MSAEGAGAPGPKGLWIVVTEKMFVIRVNNKVVVEAKYAIDLKRTPAAIDLEFQGQRTLGICDVKGGTLRICLGGEKSRFSATEIACVGPPRRDEGLFKNRSLRSCSNHVPAPKTVLSL